MSALTPLLQTRFNGIPAEGPFQVDLLVRIQAPSEPGQPGAPRAPLHLAVVLDRSGSMGGEPLRQACRCAAAILGRMGPSDRLALVAYDNRVQVLRACLPMTDPDRTREALAQVRAGGCTNLHLGWTTGVAELQKAHQTGVVSRVLLLSDGQANEGVTDPEALAEACAQAQGLGISTSTYGLGPDFGEGVMTAMARHGQGRSYYGETAEDLLDPFMEEFDLLSSLVARKLTVSLASLPGVTVTQRNGYLSPANAVWQLPDLPALGEVWALFRLEGRAQALKPWIQNGEVTLGTVAACWRDPDGVEARPAPLVLKLAVLPSAAFALLPEDALVVTRMGELAAADLQEQAFEAARAGSWDRVKALLDELRRISKDNPWTQAAVAELETLMVEGDRDVLTKELCYGSEMRRSRITQQLESSVPSDDDPSYLKRKNRQGGRKRPEPPV